LVSIGLSINVREDNFVNKPIWNGHPFKYQDLLGYTLSMSVFCLLVTWGIELLVKEIFRLG